ncbi:chemotaxis protein CheA [Stakelama saccharophila]|uniref:histidine kinase n=1 Tax=Stakelama saccharophila TaxID=3075605 RepID=A0ABZ0B6A2_9SPHN|nr:chemotaxis protein CheW [Stakelama sp. W311]WNO52772.1 chemotaxis protein CheW [Stakelama sp. W311]
MDDLLQEFIAETRETLETLSGEIIAWEAAPQDCARLDAIFRFVHTVKGSCGFLDLPRLQRLSHAAEDVLAQVREGERIPDPPLVNAVLAVVDRIGDIVEAIDAGNALDDSGEDMLIAALEKGAESSAAAATPTPRAASRSVRLNVDLLDRMMSGMSDMVLARNELARRLRADDVDPTVEAALERMSASVADMREAVTRTRMQKLDTLFSVIPRVVRDTAATLGKSVVLNIEGADVELDREMIEAMRDPLVHMIRNAIDHGLETPEERRAAGKRENGRLTVAARQSGNQIVIEIVDDGRGIDTAKVIAKLASAGARDEQEMRALPDRAKLALIFEPGLTTKEEVSDISGRGVGMDVVRAAINHIGGRIDLDNAPGKGLRIAIHVPLTLSIISAVVVRLGDQRFAVPRQAIEEIVSAQADNIRIDRLGSGAVVMVRDRKLPLVDLAELMRLPDRADRADAMLLIVSIGTGSFAIGVDGVLDNEELVIKPAAPDVMATGVYGGQTLPDNGMPMLVLDCAGIAATSGMRFGLAAEALEEDADKEEQAPGMPALLFVDLDGSTRAIPLAVVDRIEHVAGDAVRYSAGRLRIAIDGRIVPVRAIGDPAGRDRIAVLRLRDGADEVAYAVSEALDIVAIDGDIVPADEDGPVAGAVLHDGRQVEIVDANWILAGDEEAVHRADGDPICLLAGRDDGWMHGFVRPLLEQAGYRVVRRLPEGARAAVILTGDDEDDERYASLGAAVLRLSSHRTSGGRSGDHIFRYDRKALLSAVAARIEGAV